MCWCFDGSVFLLPFETSRLFFFFNSDSKSFSGSCCSLFFFLSVFFLFVSQSSVFFFLIICWVFRRTATHERACAYSRRGPPSVKGTLWRGDRDKPRSLPEFLLIRAWSPKVHHAHKNPLLHRTNSCRAGETAAAQKQCFAFCSVLRRSTTGDVSTIVSLFFTGVPCIRLRDFPLTAVLPSFRCFTYLPGCGFFYAETKI